MVNIIIGIYRQERSIAASGWQKQSNIIASANAEGAESNLSSTPYIVNNEKENNVFQMGPYILSKINQGLLVIDAVAAHDWILGV